MSRYSFSSFSRGPSVLFRLSRSDISGLELSIDFLFRCIDFPPNLIFRLLSFSLSAIAPPAIRLVPEEFPYSISPRYSVTWISSLPYFLVSLMREISQASQPSSPRPISWRSQIPRPPLAIWLSPLVTCDYSKLIRKSSFYWAGDLSVSVFAPCGNFR